jgi:hypothetical protein
MSYTDAFIQVAPDCPATTGEIPATKGEKQTVAVIQYELLSRHPYRFTQEELYFEVHVRRQGIAPAEVARRRAAIWQELFGKPQACLRTSPLPKRYGWGVHYDQAGRIAIWAVDSPEYARFTRRKNGSPKLYFAMRSKRA